MTDHDVTEADVGREIARAFGRTSSEDAASVDLFRRAGFDQDLAEQGARLLESRRFLGFEDVATFLVGRAGFEPSPAAYAHRTRDVTPGRIAEVAKSVPGTNALEG